MIKSGKLPTGYFFTCGIIYQMANGKQLLKEKSKPKALTSSQWQKKCDTKLQHKGKELYQKCEVCSKPMSCLHHFFPKSVSSRLRYDWDNLIPICNGCHMRHHQANDPTIHGTILKKRGQAWYEVLIVKKYEPMDINIGYYKYIYEMLT